MHALNFYSNGQFIVNSTFKVKRNNWNVQLYLA